MKKEDNIINSVNNKSYTISLLNYIESIILDSIIMNDFFRNIQIAETNDTEVKILVDNSFVKKYLNDEYYEILQDAVQQVFNKKKIITLIVKSDWKVEPKKEEKNPFSTINNDVKIKLDNNILERYDFEHFVEGEFNKNALRAAKKIVSSDEIIYSPLFIHSHSGLGKTHFLHAIGNEYLKQGKTVHYLSPNIFTKFVTTNLQNKSGEKINEIVDYLSGIDVLLFDDVQMYANKIATLNVIFNIFNNHILSNKQIIISADKTPEELGGFEERFITRFKGGLTLEIKHPGTNDLVKILKYKIKALELKPETWEDESINFLARNFDKSIRDIEGALNKIKFFTEDDIKNIKYTFVVVNNIFKSLEQSKENITPERIIKYVADYYKLKVNDLTSKSRKAEIVAARNVAIWLIRTQLALTHKNIGKFFGGKDHSTIITSINKMEKILKEQKEFKFVINKIKENIKKIS